MKNSFSPTVNIIRDFNNDIDYYSTPNSERVIDTLNVNVLSGFRSFYIIGSYGTGKSAFLLALEKQLSEKGKKYFETPILFNGRTKYTSLNIIGDFRSIDDSIREELKINSKKNLFNELNRYYEDSASANKGLILAIDEFGKFLEYAASNEPEKELYIIQKLAEFVNDPNKNIIFIVTLHQSIEAYSSRLEKKEKNEWEKVKGRFKEIAFNEPIEQLLYLAAKKLNRPKGIKNNKFGSLYKAIISSNVYPLKNILSKDLAEKLYPLDILSTAILTSSLKKYAQNERSLFTFLNTYDFSNQKNFFHLADVYDYLMNNLYSFLSSKFNDDYFKWTIIKNSLDRIESAFEEDVKDISLLIKTIGLLNIFAPRGSQINEKILTDYAKNAFGITNTKDILDLLIAHKILRYQNYTDSYILYEGTDLDIDIALKDAESKITPIENASSVLNHYFNFPHKSANAAYIEKGTPRFFEYIISETPIVKKPQGECDGYINLIFNKGLTKNDLIDFSKKNDEPILYVLYSNAKKIKDNLDEIEKVNYVLENNIEDRIAYRELKNLKENLINELNDLVINNLFKEKKISWFFHGEVKKVKNQKDFNKLLSEICNNVYSLTPIFRNELINREKLPASITTARKNLLANLFENWEKEDLSYSKDNFPPDKTIYLSLLQATGLHKQKNGQWNFYKPNEDSELYNLYNTCEKWLDNCKSSKRSLIELFEILSNKPYKLKKGVLDFWIPIFLFMKRDDYTLYDNDIFQPFLNIDFIDYLIRYPQNITVKAFNIEGLKLDLFNKYRTLINRSSKEKVTSNAFIDTIRPFLTFYRGLPEYTKRTQKLSDSALKLREAIRNAKDPEKTFFEDVPQAMGYSTVKLFESEKYLQDYVTQLQDSIRELRTAYDELINRIEAYLLNIIGQEEIKFPNYKIVLINRFALIKIQLLVPYQKNFYIRLTSALDDRNSWLNSIGHSLLGKNLDTINDDEEIILYDKMEKIISEFDNLCEFGKLNIDSSNEEAIKVELNFINDSLQSGIVRLTNKEIQNLKKVENKFRTELLKTNNKKLRKFLLLKLLKEELISD